MLFLFEDEIFDSSEYLIMEVKVYILCRKGWCIVSHECVCRSSLSFRILCHIYFEILSRIG